MTYLTIGIIHQHPQFYQVAVAISIGTLDSRIEPGCSQSRSSGVLYPMLLAWQSLVPLAGCLSAHAASSASADGLAERFGDSLENTS